VIEPSGLKYVCARLASYRRRSRFMPLFRPDLRSCNWSSEARWFFQHPAQHGYERAKSPQRRKGMKKSVLTITLAVATALALSQSAALAKSSKGHTAKHSAAKTHHKKHM
jgi:hypothetical protein